MSDVWNESPVTASFVVKRLGKAVRLRFARLVVVATSDPQGQGSFLEVSVHFGLPTIVLVDRLCDSARHWPTTNRNPGKRALLTVVEVGSQLTEAGVCQLLQFIRLAVDAVCCQVEDGRTLCGVVVVVELRERIFEIANGEESAGDAEAGERQKQIPLHRGGTKYRAVRSNSGKCSRWCRPWMVRWDGG